MRRSLFIVLAVLAASYTARAAVYSSYSSYDDDLYPDDSSSSSSSYSSYEDYYEDDEPEPVNCLLSKWSKWSKCSQPCGSGTQTRTRSVVVKAAHGGLACPGNLKATKACNTKRCKPHSKGKNKNHSNKKVVTNTGGGSCVCTNTCKKKHAGKCEDGGPGAAFDRCAPGTDCASCGPSNRAESRGLQPGTNCGSKAVRLTLLQEMELCRYYDWGTFEKKAFTTIGTPPGKVCVALKDLSICVLKYHKKPKWLNKWTKKQKLNRCKYRATMCATQPTCGPGSNIVGDIFHHCKDEISDPNKCKKEYDAVVDGDTSFITTRKGRLHCGSNKAHGSRTGGASCREICMANNSPDIAQLGGTVGCKCSFNFAKRKFKLPSHVESHSDCMDVRKVLGFRRQVCDPFFIGKPSKPGENTPQSFFMNYCGLTPDGAKPGGSQNKNKVDRATLPLTKRAESFKVGPSAGRQAYDYYGCAIYRGRDISDLSFTTAEFISLYAPGFASALSAGYLDTKQLTIATATQYFGVGAGPQLEREEVPKCIDESDASKQVKDIKINAMFNALVELAPKAVTKKISMLDVINKAVANQGSQYQVDWSKARNEDGSAPTDVELLEADERWNKKGLVELPCKDHYCPCCCYKRHGDTCTNHPKADAEASQYGTNFFDTCCPKPGSANLLETETGGCS